MPVFDLTPIKNDPENSETPVASGTAIEKEDKQLTGKQRVEIEGPLSAIYTQALNIAFAKESAADGEISQLMEVNELNDEGVDPSLYVYAGNEKTLDLEGVGKHFDKLRVALDKYKDKKSIVVIEDFSVGKSRLAVEALEDYAASNKANLYHVRAHAIHAITQALKQPR